MGMRRKNPVAPGQRGIREVAIGLASVAVIAGLLATPYGMPLASAAAQGDAIEPEVTETYVGSTELTAEEATERAEAAEAEDVPEEDVAEGQLIVELFPGTNEDVVMATVTEGTSMRVAERLMAPDGEFGGMYLVSVPSGMELNEARAHILENTQVKSASYDTFLRAEGVTGDDESVVRAESTNPAPYANDPKLANKWEDDADFLDFQGTWNTAYDAGWRDSSNVTVAVIDSGLNASHEDLRDNIVAMHDATSARSGMGDLLGGHGTSVAGIVSSRNGNGIGTASLAYNAHLLPIQVFSTDQDDEPGALCSDIARGMNWLLTAGPDGVTPAERYHVKVANLSAGVPANANNSTNDPAAPSVVTAINRLWSNGIVVVNSIGNQVSGTSLPYRHWPTSATNCVGVINLERESSTSSRVRRQEKSNYNINATTIDARVSAPGTNILTTANDGGYTSAFSGASAATPQVSSLLALMYSIYMDMDANTATSILYRNVKPTIENSVMYTGNGMISPKAAVIDTIAQKRQANPSTSDLSGLSCDVGGQPYGSFNHRLNSFNIPSYGTVTSDPDTSVTFHGRPALWTQSESYTRNSSSETKTDGTIITTHTAKRSITFTSVNTNSYTGDKIRHTYDFNFTWQTVSNDPNFPILNELANLKASAGGSQLGGFGWQTTDYPKDYGTIPVTQSLPSEVTLTGYGPSWTVTADPSNPTADTVTSSVASDGTTTGTKSRTLRYTLSATGADGQPLTRLYTFRLSARYADDSTRYANVIRDAGTRLVIDGQPYGRFDPEQPSYSLERPDQASFDAVTSPSFDNLPDGWTQAVTGPAEGVETIDKGNGKSIRRSSKRYAITLSKGGAHVPYTVTFYLDTEIDNPSGESSSDQGDQGQGGTTDGQGQGDGQGGSQGGQEQGDGQGDQQGQQGSSSQGGQPTGGATGGQQGAKQGNRNATGGQLEQTGDATVPVALAVVAGAITAIATTSGAKARRKA